MSKSGKGPAEQSGGALAIQSRRGEGTEVTLWLPEAPEAVRAACVAPEPEAAKAGGEEAAPVCRVPPLALVVDDDAGVRETVAEGLEMLGWRVQEAEDAKAALKALAAGLAPDVLVTDLAMPGTDGLALIRAARESRAGLPALLVTGHAGDVTPGPLAAAAGSGPFNLLRKPLGLDDLSARA